MNMPKLNHLYNAEKYSVLTNTYIRNGEIRYWRSVRVYSSLWIDLRLVHTSCKSAATSNCLMCIAVKIEHFPTPCSNAFHCGSCCNLQLVWTRLNWLTLDGCYGSATIWMQQLTFERHHSTHEVQPLHTSMPDRLPSLARVVHIFGPCRLDSKTILAGT